LFLFEMSNGSIFAQSYTINGKVTDAGTHRPLSQVYITDVEDMDNYTVSDQEGYFSLKTDYKEGKLSFSLVGFVDQILNYNEGEEMNVALIADEVNLGAVLIKSFNSYKQNKETPGAIAVLSQKQIQQGSGVSIQAS